MNERKQDEKAGSQIAAAGKEVFGPGALRLKTQSSKLTAPKLVAAAGVRQHRRALLRLRRPVPESAENARDGRVAHAHPEAQGPRNSG